MKNNENFLSILSLQVIMFVVATGKRSYMHQVGDCKLGASRSIDDFQGGEHCPSTSYHGAAESFG